MRIYTQNQNQLKIINKEFFGKEFTFPEKSKLFKNSVSLLLIYIFKTIYTYAEKMCGTYAHKYVQGHFFYSYLINSQRKPLKTTQSGKHHEKKDKTAGQKPRAAKICL